MDGEFGGGRVRSVGLYHRQVWIWAYLLILVAC